MKRFPYQKADAFAVNGSTGNPAACLFLNADEYLHAEEMLAIAKEHQHFVSEVVFCTWSPLGIHADFKLQYYSSEREVDFCGHGTIACMYSLISSCPSLRFRQEVTIATKRGVQTVYNEIAESDTVYITSPPPEYIGTTLTRAQIADALSIPPAEISQEYPIDLINVGQNTLIVPIVSLASELAIFPDERKLKKFSLANNIECVAIFSKEVQDGQHTLHTRVFATVFGYLEDPATGSANSAVGRYLLKNKLWSGEPISLEQGPDPKSFNVVRLRTHAVEGTEPALLFGGRAAVKIDGYYYI